MIPRGLPLPPEAVDLEAFHRLRTACHRWRFLPTFSEGLLLQVAMVDPDELGALHAIRALTHQEVRPFAVDAAAFAPAIAACDAAFESSRSALAEPLAAASRVPDAPPLTWGLLRGRTLATELIAYAHACGASDLLVDDQSGWTDIAVQRAGRKEILAPLDRDCAAGVFRAFKEMAGLQTHTVLQAQTGAIRWSHPTAGAADLRLEVTPTVQGESLVARLQDPALQLRRMATLPFTDAAQRAAVLGCLRQRQGLILATGPTGQGKTSTLYACLGALDRSQCNIRTLEDPVELVVPWITQIPVGAGTGRDFAAGLKSLLRQAPQVILLGELRDRAAAQTCIEAVDTGHLLLATLHTRDAPGVVARLLDLGLTGRQIAAGLELAIGQRLLRRLCPECRHPAAPPDDARPLYCAAGLPVPDQIWDSAGCPHCAGRGDSGRVAVFELFLPRTHPAIETMIPHADLAHFDERALRQLWIQSGAEPIARAALRLAAAGDVSYSEARSLATLGV